MRHMPRGGLCILPAIGLTALALHGCVLDPNAPPAEIDLARGVVGEVLVAGGADITALAAAADGRVFFAERATGNIRVIKNGVLLDAPLVRVPVNYAGGRGLLGLALHPDFALNGRLYVFYTRSDTDLPTDNPLGVIDHRVVYFDASGDVATGGEVFVWSMPTGEGVHRVGGRIAFSSDAKLYIALGDETNKAAAQDPSSWLGKVLRINDDGTIPGDNPTADSPVYASGLRDVTGLAVDPDSDTAFLVEPSQGGVFEINRILSGRNYGWPDVIGWADTDAERAFAAATDGYADPLVEARLALAGAAFNPSSKYGANVRMHLFYGDSTRGRIRHATLSASRGAIVETAVFANNVPTPIRDVQFTPAGTMYIASRNLVLRATLFP